MTRAEFPAIATIRCIYSPDFAHAERRPPQRATTSLDEERQELLDSLLDALKSDEPDADRLAVCGGLLRHLAKAGRRV